MKPVKQPHEVPQNMTDEQSAVFWDTREMTDDFRALARPLEESEMPPVRTDAKTITVRFDTDTLNRRQTLVRQKHKAYQTLLKQFIIERQYEEEKKQSAPLP